MTSYRIKLIATGIAFVPLVVGAAVVPAHKTGDQAKSSWSGVVAQAPAPYRR
jgi:hypothetical protein